MTGPAVDAAPSTRQAVRPGGPRALVAFDHRRLFERMATSANVPAEAIHGTIATAKDLIYEAVETVLDEGTPGSEAIGVLVDEQFAATIALQARSRAIPLAIAVERNEAEPFALEYDRHWLNHVQALTPDYVKVLFRWRRQGQQHQAELELLVEVATTCREHDYPLLLELIPQAADTAKLSDEILELVARGVAPATWKIPTPSSVEEAQTVVAATRAGGSTPDILLLGGAAPHDEVLERLARYLLVDGITGWAVGRALWEGPLMESLRGARSEATVEAIAQRLRRFLDVLPPALSPRDRRVG